MLKVAFPSLDHLPQTREAGERRARDMAQWARKCSVKAIQDGTKAQCSDDRCYFSRQIVSKKEHFVGIDGQNCLARDRPRWNRTMSCVVYIATHSPHSSEPNRHGPVTDCGVAHGTMFKVETLGPNSEAPRNEIVTNIHLNII